MKRGKTELGKKEEEMEEKNNEQHEVEMMEEEEKHTHKVSQFSSHQEATATVKVLVPTLKGLSPLWVNMCLCSQL